MTRKCNSVLFCFFITLFATSFLGINAQNKITYAVTSSDCNKMVVQFTCKNSYKWEIIDKKLNAKKTQFVDTLMVISGANIKYTFTHKGYYSVKAYYKDNFDENVEIPADTTVSFTPYADFQVVQKDNATNDKMVDLTINSLFTKSDSSKWFIGGKFYSNQNSSISRTLSSGVYTISLVKYLGGCKDSISSKVIVVRAQLTDTTLVNTFPNVFTPNEDNVNDVFYIPTPVQSYTDGSKNNEYTFEVYNRGGMLVYKSVSPIIQWNGRTLDGKLVKPGQYFYTVKLNNTTLPSKQKAVHLLMIYN